MPINNNLQKNLLELSTLTTFIRESIQNELANNTITEGEYLDYLLRCEQSYIPLIELKEKFRKNLEDFAKSELEDNGTQKSNIFEKNGLKIFVKFAYPKPTLDSEKLKTELVRAYADIGAEFIESEFLKPSTPRKTVVIQPKI